MVTPDHPAFTEITQAQAGYMIDVTGKFLPGLLAALNGRWPDVLAGYVTGLYGVDWPPAQLVQLHGKVGLFRYDQTPQLALFAAGSADGADIERGAGTTGAFIAAARKREARGWWSWAYINQAAYDEFHKEVKAAGLTKVQYGIANWNDNLAQAVAQLGPEVVYVQWASPSSNPRTVAPLCGGKTLAELQCDLNATRPGWFKPRPAPAVQRGLLVTDPGGDLKGRLVTSADGKTWELPA